MSARATTNIISPASSYAQTFEDKDELELQFISDRRQHRRLLLRPVGQASRPERQDIAGGHRYSRSPGCLCRAGIRSTGERIMAVSSPMIYSERGGHRRSALCDHASAWWTGRSFCLPAVRSAVGALVFVGVRCCSAAAIYHPLHSWSRWRRSPRPPSGSQAGSYGVQIQTKYDDEIGELADTINDMSAKISQNEKIAVGVHFLSVSHELRTPLTAITGWSETILGARRPGRRRHGAACSIILPRGEAADRQWSRSCWSLPGCRTAALRSMSKRPIFCAEFEDTVFMYGSRLKQEGIDAQL